MSDIPVPSGSDVKLNDLSSYPSPSLPPLPPSTGPIILPSRISTSNADLKKLGFDPPEIDLAVSHPRVFVASEDVGRFRPDAAGGRDRFHEIQAGILDTDRFNLAHNTPITTEDMQTRRELQKKMAAHYGEGYLEP